MPNQHLWISIKGSRPNSKGFIAFTSRNTGTSTIWNINWINTIELNRKNSKRQSKLFKEFKQVSKYRSQSNRIEINFELINTLYKR
jgi:hypothetical protein